MKAVIVNSRTLRAYRRMDADFYTGTVAGQEYQDKIRRRRKLIKTMQQGLRTLQEQQRAHKAKVAAMIEAGEIIPVKKQKSNKKSRSTR